jgi:hypothetical protein
VHRFVRREGFGDPQAIAHAISCFRAIQKASTAWRRTVLVALARRSQRSRSSSLGRVDTSPSLTGDQTDATRRQRRSSSIWLRSSSVQNESDGGAPGANGRGGLGQPRGADRHPVRPEGPRDRPRYRIASATVASRPTADSPPPPLRAALGPYVAAADPEVGDPVVSPDVGPGGLPGLSLQLGSGARDRHHFTHSAGTVSGTDSGAWLTSARSRSRSSRSAITCAYTRRVVAESA